MNTYKWFPKINSRQVNIGLIAIGLVFIMVELPRVSDFRIFLLASEALGNGEDIYYKRYIDGFRYYYSPLFAILLNPLTLIPDYLAATLWSLLSFGLLVRTFVLLHNYLPLENSKSGFINAAVVLAGLTLIYASFHNNQMSAFILWSIVESVYLAKKQKWVIAGIILALSINIKLLPLVFIPYLIYRRYFKTAILSLILLIVFWILPALFIGWDYNLELLKSYWSNINPSKGVNVVDIEEPGLMSISTLISTWFTDQFSINELGLRRHLMVLSDQVIGTIINLVRLGFILLTLYFLRWPPFKTASSKIHELWELAYLSMVIPIIFPHQQNYGFFLILPAIFYSVYQLWFSQIQWSRSLKWLFIIAALLMNLELIFGAYKKFFWNYKVLTYGVLLLCLVLTILNPLKAKTE